MAIEDVPRVVGGAVFRDEGFHRDRGRHADPQHPPTHPPTHPTHPPRASALSITHKLFSHHDAELYVDQAG